MAKYDRCERCRDEHTAKCKTCKPPELVHIGVEEAIAYFQEENETYEFMLGDKANQAREYRIYKIAIEALEKMKA